jgi:aryl-alcohol dehydrogenase-like predicted oxidoreductase
MRRLRIAETDLDVAPVALGLADFGTRLAGPEACGLLETFLSLGGNFLDTAHCYSFWLPGGLGISEGQLGQCLLALGCRDEVVLATKGGHPDGGEGYPRPDRYLAPEVIARDVDESLERLGTDHVELYYLHRDDPRVPVGEVMEALNAEVARGRVQWLGASNWSVARLAAGREYAAAHGLRGFAVSQVQFSLATPHFEIGPDPTMRYLTDEDAGWHAATQVAVTAYTPSANGYFGGRPEAEGAWEDSVNAGRRERARQLAGRLGCTPTQVALAWLLHQRFPVVPTVGTLNAEHLREALGAAEIALTGEQTTWLRSG